MGQDRALRWMAGLGHAQFGVLAGYGWRPQRLLLWTLLVWLGAATLFGFGQQEGALLPASTPALTPFSPLPYTLDLLLPGIDLHERSRWSLAPGAVQGFGWSDAARLAGWLVQLFGALAAALLLVSLAGWADRDRRR